MPPFRVTGFAFAYCPAAWFYFLVLQNKQLPAVCDTKPMYPPETATFLNKPASVKKIIGCLLPALLYMQCLFAQQEKTADSSLLMDKVMVTAFQQNKTVSCGAIVKMLSVNNADRFNKTSLVHGFNTIAGVRMEERSPGSYRINIRGSSLRSPFGVRNVKVYWNDIPVTDPGGSTYFNQFAFNNFSYIEIFKGPAGSMYGAGTGGLLLMHAFNTGWKPSVNLEYITGSYGLQQVLASAALGKENNRTLIAASHNTSDGYRDNTGNRKDNFSFSTQYKISGKQLLTTSILYTDLFYQTPGALTLAEFTANLKQARPAAGGLPSAAAAKATIYQKNFLAGISHTYNFSAAFKNTTVLYGAFAQIKNPTFRNYERRNEPSFGGRSSFTYETTVNETKLQLVAGAELQEGFFNTLVSKNKNGNPDTVQTNDDIRYSNYHIFLQGTAELAHGWVITAGASTNRSRVHFTRLSKYPVAEQERTYQNEIAPRIALQKKIGNNYTVFANMAKGFSPPTVAELLPSTGVISTFLEAEEGVNYEAGGRLSLLKNKLQLEATAFYFKLYNALVSRKDSSNADYFVNAGNAKQKGLELGADYTTFFHGRILNTLVVKTAFSSSNFRYGSFQKGSTDFSGKYLPGVPANTVSLLADLQFKNGCYLNSTYYYSDKIFLDDANSVAAKHYHLLGARAGFKTTIQSKLQLNFYLGADNLLNEVYSLGNDINAAGGRYYNAAPLRNYYAGVALQLNRFSK